MFDIFTYFSIQLIYLLTIFYEKINIIKPVTSRPANSEKYIISCGFKNPILSQHFIKSMLDELETWDTIYDEKYNSFKSKDLEVCNFGGFASRGDDPISNSIYFPLYTENSEDLTVINTNKNVENEIIIDNLDVPEHFIEEIKNINISVTNNQKEYIIKTLEYITKYNLNNTQYDKYYQLKYSNLWFDKYNIVKKENLCFR